MFHRLLLSLFVLALGAAFSACSRPETVPKAVQEAESGKGSSGSALISSEFNVGDAETSIELYLELDPDTALLPNVKEDRILNAKHQLSQSNVTLDAATQKEFWVRIRIRPTKPFVERPVVLRGVLERDGQPIVSFQTVLGKYATEDDPDHPKVFRVNVLDGLAAPPASMLLFARAEVLLMPAGTDEKTIDTANATADQGDISAKISNPMRITLQLPPPSPLAIPTPATPAESPATAPASSPAEAAPAAPAP